MDGEIGWDGSLDLVEELPELIGAVPWIASADHRAGGGVERSEQRRGAMALAVMGAPFNLAWTDRQQGLATVERLDLRLMVHAREQSPFDRAAGINTLYLWPAPRGGLRELLRVIKPEVRLLLACIGPETAGTTRALRTEFRVAVFSRA
jgi:hypothetical protein